MDYQDALEALETYGVRYDVQPYCSWKFRLDLLIARLSDEGKSLSNRLLRELALLEPVERVTLAKEMVGADLSIELLILADVK